MSLCNHRYSYTILYGTDVTRFTLILFFCLVFIRKLTALRLTHKFLANF